MKRILFATSEAVPFIKTGGLADVAGALPKCFDKRYFDVRVILPEQDLSASRVSGSHPGGIRSPGARRELLLRRKQTSQDPMVHCHTVSDR